MPFIKAENNQNEIKLKFKLPSIDLLKYHLKMKELKSNKNENNDPDIFEKILLDFGVNGKLKKLVMVQLLH